MELPNEAPAAEAETSAPETAVADTPASAPERAAQTQEPVAAAQAPDGPKEPFWYRKELREKEKRARQLERQLEQLQARAPESGPQNVPDIYADPQGFQGYLQQTVESVRYEMRLENSERFARMKYSDDTWEETNDWLFSRPDVAQWAKQQPDPWGAAIQLYQKEKLAAEIGDSPDAWREKERERLKAELLAEMQGGTPGAKPATNIPRSIAGARNVASASAPSDDRPVFLKDRR